MGAEGVLWGQGSSPTLTRYHGDASGNTVYTPATQAAATSYFSARSPWGWMGRVSMRPDGSVASRCKVNQTSLQTSLNWGDNCYSDTNVDNNGEQKMVYVPQFCSYADYVAEHNIVWWVGLIGDSFTLQAADGTFTGAVHTLTSSDIHPAFLVDGVAKSGAYVGAYEAYNSGSTLQSVAGVAPTVSQNKLTFRGQAEALGVGWELETIQMHAALQLLATIETGTLSSQASTALLGYGATQVGTTLNTGTTTSYGNASYGTTADTVHANSYRGVENIFGNLQHFLEGLRTDATDVYWICPQTNVRTAGLGYSESIALGTAGLPYVTTSITAPTTTAYTISVTPAVGWGFIPLTTGGSLSTYFCDSVTIAAGGAVFTTMGFAASGSAFLAGLYAYYGLTGTPSSTVLGARLQYFPQ